MIVSFLTASPVKEDFVRFQNSLLPHFVGLSHVVDCVFGPPEGRVFSFGEELVFGEKCPCLMEMIVLLNFR